MKPITITENSVQAFHKRLAALTATEPSDSEVCIRAETILRYEANKRIKEVRLNGDFRDEQRLKIWWKNRPVKRWNWYHEIVNSIDNIMQ